MAIAAPPPPVAIRPNTTAMTTCSYNSSSGVFTKRDGSRIELHFQNHEPPGDAATAAAKILSNDGKDAARAIDQFLTKNQALLTQRLELYNSVIQKSTGLSFLAIEEAPEAISGNAWEETNQTMTRFADRLNLLGVDDTRIRNLFVTIFNPYVYYRFTNGSRSSSIKLIGADDPEAKTLAQHSSVAIKIEEARLEQLNRSGRVPQWLTSRLKELFATALSTQMPIDETTMSLVLTRILDPEVKDSVRDLFYDVGVVASTLPARDLAVARHLLAETGNGALLMGADHGTGVISDLTRLCLQSRNP
jgi:hypothetical protein